MMFSVSRTGAPGWLRLALAVVALLAMRASVTRAAFGTTCARPGASSVSALVGGAAQGAGSVAVDSESGLEATHDPSSHAPPQPAVVLQCATGVATLTAVVGVPTPAALWDRAALPLSSQLRPPSVVTSPPFRPPRES